jgi:hypothetical protein
VGVQELPQLPLRSAREPCRWCAAMADGSAQQLPLFHRLALPDSWAAAFAGFPVGCAE